MVLQVAQLLIFIIMSVREHRTEVVVFERGEEKALIGIETHGFSDNTIFHGFQVFWTFGHNDDVSTILALQRLTESSGR